MEAIYEAALSVSVNFLVSSFEGVANNLFFREDLPFSNGDEHDSTTSEDNLMHLEESRRIIKITDDDKTEGMAFNESLLTCDDWEEILTCPKLSTFCSQ